MEPVGAGDAFAAGYLAAWLRGADSPDRLAVGHSLAAWTLGTHLDYRPGHGREVRPLGDDGCEARAQRVGEHVPHHPEPEPS